MGKTFTLGLYPNIGISSSGTPTTNYLPKFASATTIGNSIISENSNEISINVAFPTLIFNGSRDYALQSNDTSGSFRIIDNTAGLERFSISNSGAATFPGSGNGIPLIIQDISAAITGQTAGYIGMSTSAFSGNNGDLVLYPRTSATSKILLMGGNVGIGTASPSEKLHLYDSNYPVIRMSAGAATTDSYYLYANQSARFYITNVNTGNGAYLQYNSSSGWTSVSDARWKTDWTSIDGSLNLINRLNIGKYKMLNNDKEVIENARWDYGIKAQELLNIIPDAVDVPKDENDKYGVIHNIVFYNAIKAIQELSAQVQEQNQTIQSLQEQNQDLKSRLDKAGL